MAGLVSMGEDGDERGKVKGWKQVRGEVLDRVRGSKGFLTITQEVF